MLKVNVLVDLFFKEVSFPERIPKVAECGYSAIETWQGKDAVLLKEIGKACSENNVDFASIVLNGVGDNAVAPSWKGNLEAFLERIDKYSDNALAAGCRSGIVTAGNLNEKQSTDEHCKYLTESLKKAGELAAKKGFNLNLEPLNTLVDHKGYFLDSRETALEIVKEINMPNVKMLYDIYHMEIMTGNHTEFITANIKYIGHFHCAGVPGRHEPFNGETNYPFIMKKIEEAAYEGYFGLEYMPLLSSTESLMKTLKYFKSGKQ
ncbi:MAG: hypothetical protein A2017_03645 [Lentisphaerae bacterium GWF2_44_16]|nr:MAG: hypothetical protein A2017_03645 [Lentisphaerae bacterium GWF2_44_16]